MDEDGFTIEWPLWGVSLVDRPIGVDGAMQIHDSFLYQPSWAQWADMESTAVIDEYCARWVYDERRGKDTPRLPPPCLMRFSQMTASGEPDVPFEEHQQIAGQVVAAMRLYDGGDFVDPAETGMYVSPPSGQTMREVKVFRCSPYNWAPETPYLVALDDIDDLANLMAGVHNLEEDPNSTNAALAIESFVLSFGLATSPAERGLHRFIALEALLGPLGERRNGTTFAVRVANAFPGDADEVGEWVDGAVELRNALAHRIHETSPDEEDLRMLEDITRAVIVAYLNHHRTAGDDPVRSFNEVLAAGPIEMNL